MPRDKDSLFFCRPPVPGNRAKDLLGRAIVQGRDREHLVKPLEGHVFPALPPTGPDLAKLLPTLHPTLIEGKDIEYIKSLADEKQANIILESLSSIFYKNSHSKVEAANAVAFSRMTMEEQPSKIRALLDREDYRKPIIDHLTAYPDYDLGVVVDVITAHKLKWEQRENSNKQGGGAVNTNLDKLVQGPNIKVEVSAKHEMEQQVRAEFTSDVVIACGYLPLALRKKSFLGRFLGTFRGIMTMGNEKRNIDDLLVGSNLLSLPTLRINNHNRPIYFGDDDDDDNSDDGDNGEGGDGAENKRRQEAEEATRRKDEIGSKQSY